MKRKSILLTAISIAVVCVSLLLIGCENNQEIILQEESDECNELLEDVITVVNHKGEEVVVDFNSEEYKVFREGYLRDRKTRYSNISTDDPMIRNVPSEAFIRDQYKALQIVPPLEPIAIESEISNNQIKRARTTSSWVMVTIPHYYEFDEDENPNRNYWCGHAALKCVAKYHGEYKTLGNIHTAFWNNSSGYRNDRNNDGKYAASMLDLLWAANNQNGGSWNYDFPTTSSESVSSMDRYYQRLKDGVNYKKPAIVASYYNQTYGHFYPVTGYYEVKKSDGSIDYDNSYLLLRDVIEPSKIYTSGEHTVSVRTFYNKRISNSILFVRPWKLV